MLESDRLAQRIRAFRKLKGYTQLELADLAGISLSVLGSVERGTRKADHALIVKIAQALHIDPQELMASP